MNVAVFLPGWIGDAVMATPALRALRTHFAEGKLIAVVKPYVAGVLAGNNWFDEQLLLGNEQMAPFQVACQLRRRTIDLAVLFPNSFRSALVAWLGGCRDRVGYRRYFRSFMLTKRLEPVRDDSGSLTPSPAIDAYNSIVQSVGCPNPGYRMELFTTPDDEAMADLIWTTCGFDRVVCLNPGGAFGSSKHWPTSYFADVARRLAVEHGYGVLVLCGPAEKEECQRIVIEAAHSGVCGLCDFPLSLGLTKACVRRAALLITTDSGPRHFAAAFNRPVVTLFGPTHIEWTETYFPLALHLQKSVPCGPCQKRVCPLDHRCMTELTPNEVLRSALRLLPGRRVSA